MLPPTYLTCLEVGLHASPARGARRGHRPGPVEMFTPEVEGVGRRGVAVDPASGCAPLVEHRLSMTWAGGSFGVGARCACWPPTPRR